MQDSFQPTVEVSVNPRQVALVLVKILAIAVIGHITVRLLSSFYGITSTPLVGVYRFFNMGNESNFPTYVSALYLLFSGLLCFLVAYRELMIRKYLNWHWWGLTTGLMIMSIDEAAQIHEGVIGVILEEYLGKGVGLMYYRWYLAYIPIVAIVACLYLPFLKRLPLRYSSRFLLSGLVYISGAIGVEMIESSLSYRGSSIAISILVEETLEMLGIVILIHTLLLYLSELNYALRLNFTTNASVLTQKNNSKS